MNSQHSDYLIIGAGMAGLSCAVKLKAAGHSVRVLDKGRGPGGRMAARRAEIGGETVSFDHGAQFFTARDTGFRAAVLEWQTRGAAALWPAAGEASAEEAWVGTPGMNGPIKAMASDLDVLWSARALALTRTDSGWHVDAGEANFTAKTVLIAVPAEQASELLSDVAPDLAAIPAAVVSEPCWAVMAGFAEPLDIRQDTVSAADAAISWAARNSAKPERTGTEGWVLHASPARSKAIIDLPKEDAAQVLLADFFEQTGAAAQTPIHIAAHRWLYAQPKAAKSGEAAHFDAEARIGIAGDYLHSPRVEGAWLSGAALASKVLTAP